MPIATITSKGQVTIPKAVREALGVDAGDRLAFRIQEDGTVLVEAETVDLLALGRRLKPLRRGITLDDMNAAIRRGGRTK
jgi:antitoxin PrlF